jgi:hypothetical protein
MVPLVATSFPVVKSLVSNLSRALSEKMTAPHGIAFLAILARLNETPDERCSLYKVA